MPVVLVKDPPILETMRATRLLDEVHRWALKHLNEHKFNIRLNSTIGWLRTPSTLKSSSVIMVAHLCEGEKLVELAALQNSCRP